MSSGFPWFPTRLLIKFPAGFHGRKYRKPLILHSDSKHNHPVMNSEALEGLVLGQSKTERTNLELGSWQRQSLSQAGDW